MQMDNQPITPTNAARPFGEVPSLWTRVMQMNEEFFAAEMPRASATNTILSVVIYAVAAAIFTAIMAVLASALNTSDSATGSLGVASACYTLFAIPLGFYIGHGILFISAMIFGGKGSFNSQTYLGSLFQVPLGLISSAASILTAIPIVGPIVVALIALGIGIYSLFMNIRMFKVVHNFTTGKAVGAVLAPMLLLCIIPLCVIGVLMLLGPGIGEIFSGINSSLQGVSP